MTYTPTPAELRERKRMTDYLTQKKWDDDIVMSIMIYDNPTIETVKKMIDKFGEAEAQKKIRRMISDDD